MAGRSRALGSAGRGATRDEPGAAHADATGTLEADQDPIYCRPDVSDPPHLPAHRDAWQPPTATRGRVGDDARDDARDDPSRGAAQTVTAAAAGFKAIDDGRDRAP